MNHSEKSPRPFASLNYVFGAGLLLFILGAFLFRTEIISYGNGTIEAKKHTLLFSPVEAQVVSISLKPGEIVKQGQVLMTLHNEDVISKNNELKKQLLDINHLIQQNLTTEEICKITGFIPEIQSVDSLAKIHAKKTKTIDKIRDIYGKLATSKLISEITYLNHQLKEIHASEEKLKIDQWLYWKSSNMEALKKAAHLQKRIHMEQTRDYLMAELNRNEDFLNKLIIKAPFDGVVTESYIDFSAQLAKKGQPLLRIEDVSEGFRVVAEINESNIDLIQKEMTVRMKSKVFKSEIVGYIHGKVDRIVRPNSYQQNGLNEGTFKIWIEMTSYPGTPVPATGVEVEVIIGKENLINSILGRPYRSNES